MAKSIPTLRTGQRVPTVYNSDIHRAGQEDTTGYVGPHEHGGRQVEYPNSFSCHCDQIQDRKNFREKRVSFWLQLG